LSPGESGVNFLLARLLFLLAGLLFLRLLVTSGSLWTILTAPRPAAGSFGSSTTIAETLEDFLELTPVECTILVGIAAFEQSGHVVGQFSFFEFSVFVTIQPFD